MTQDNGQASDASAEKPLAAALARLDDFSQRLQGVAASLQGGIDKPATALLGLLKADMDEPKKMLAGVTAGLGKLRALRGELAGLDVHAEPKRSGALGKAIDEQVWMVKEGVKLTLAAIQRADRDLAADVEFVADTALEVDKFLYAKAPEVLGALTLTLTKSKQAAALVEGGASVVQRAAAGASAAFWGVSGADIDAAVGSMQKAEIDAVVKLLTSLIGPRVGDTEKVSHVLATLAMNVSKEVFAAARAAQDKKLKPEELERVLMAAALKGYGATLGGMVKALPLLADREVGKKIFDALAKVATAAAMAKIKQGDVGEAAKEAGWDVVKDTALEQVREGVAGSIEGKEEERVRKGAQDEEGAKAMQRAERTAWIREVLKLDLNARTLEAVAS